MSSGPNFEAVDNYLVYSEQTDQQIVSQPTSCTWSNEFHSSPEEALKTSSSQPQADFQQHALSFQSHHPSTDPPKPAHAHYHALVQAAKHQ